MIKVSETRQWLVIWKMKHSLLNCLYHSKVVLSNIFNLQQAYGLASIYKYRIPSVLSYIFVSEMGKMLYTDVWHVNIAFVLCWLYIYQTEQKLHHTLPRCSNIVFWMEKMAAQILGCNENVTIKSFHSRPYLI